jgi:hypothetical protein
VEVGTDEGGQEHEHCGDAAARPLRPNVFIILTPPDAVASKRHMTVAPVAALITQKGGERLKVRNRCVQRFRGYIIIADSLSADRT